MIADKNFLRIFCGISAILRDIKFQKNLAFRGLTKNFANILDNRGNIIFSHPKPNITGLVGRSNT